MEFISFCRHGFPAVFCIFASCRYNNFTDMSFWEKIMAVLRWLRNHKYLFVTAVFLVIVLLLDDKSMVRHLENKKKIDTLKKEISVMRRDSAVLVARNASLDNEGDNVELEKYGCDAYNMHSSQQEVYIQE